MNRLQRRSLERQVRRGKVSSEKRISAEGEPLPAGQTLLMGEIAANTFQTDDCPIVAVQVRNVGGHCVVGLTPDDVAGLLDALKLVLEDVEVAEFVATVEAETGGPAKVVGI